MRILLTGGTGYIGSHAAVELLQAGHEVLLVDDYSNSSADVVSRIETITRKKITAFQADVCDPSALEQIFSLHSIDAVIHFAGYKSVGESVAQPLKYYRNNLDSTLTLLEVMRRHQVKNFVFSSSATVYGDAGEPPYSEETPAGTCSNPYGRTKCMIEQILQDVAAADPSFSVMLLRYFNPIGAHESGLLGERPNGIPNNLLPYITQTAIGLLDHLNVFGDDYPTPDGTGVRDYIHVVDLARGHVKALEYAQGRTGAEVFNLGTGVGYSVLEVVHTFERVNQVHIPFVIQPRRPGDLPSCYADPSKAQRLLGWQAEKNLEDMCRDSWRWQQQCDAAN